MALYNLQKTITELPSLYYPEENLIRLPQGYCTPGLWTVIATLAYDKGYDENNIEFSNHDQKSYSRTIGLGEALNPDPITTISRPNEGSTYSPLVKIDNVDSTDKATSTINNCLRSFSIGNNQSEGFRSLCHVIGELHSNVWDHGLNTAFSAAQKSKVPYEDDYYFEFALADSGCGFRQEMLRTGHTCENDLDAIAWCIEEGHSTKMIESRDDFAQRLPTDHIGNPFGTSIETFESDGNESHHQGLGLAKLVDLIIETNSELCLISGHGIFTIDQKGVYNYQYMDNYWSGVALSCRFKSSCLFTEEEPTSPDIKGIMDVLMEDANNGN